MAIKYPGDPILPPPEDVPDNSPDSIENTSPESGPTPPVGIIPVQFSPTAMTNLLSGGASSTPIAEINSYQASIGTQLRAAIDGQTIPIKMSVAGLAAMVAQLAAIVASIPMTPPVPKMPVLPPFVDGDGSAYAAFSGNNILGSSMLAAGAALIPPAPWYDILDYKLERLTYKYNLVIQLLGVKSAMEDYNDETWTDLWNETLDDFKKIDYISNVTLKNHFRDDQITYQQPVIGSLYVFKNIKEVEFEVPGNKLPLGDVRNISADIRNTFPESFRSNLVIISVIRIVKWWILNSTTDERKGPFSTRSEAERDLQDLGEGWTISSTSERLPYLNDTAALPKDIYEKVLTIRIPIAKIRAPIRRQLKITNLGQVTD